MARLFPLRTDVSTGDPTPRVVDLDDEDADDVFRALSSTTAREIYSTLTDEPGTPSDIAEAIDSSIQNVRYHLDNLEGAGLVEVVDTWYSSRGNEMSVYAPADGPLIVTSDRSTGDKLKTAISRFVGGVGALAGASLLVQFALERYLTTPQDDASREFTAADGDDTAEPGLTDDPDEPVSDDQPPAEADEPAIAVDDPADEDPSPDDTEPDSEREEIEDTADDPDTPDTRIEEDTDPVTYETERPDDVDSSIADGTPEAMDTIIGTIPPGALFFLGGFVVLVAVTAYWYWATTY